MNFNDSTTVLAAACAPSTAPIRLPVPYTREELDSMVAEQLEPRRIHDEDYYGTRGYR